jgi:outer membrane beta-barrel protein
MNKLFLKKSLITIILLLSSLAHAAEEVEVPSDELAKESVLPVFDNVISVKNRNVSTEGRFDAGLFGGLALTEPIANTTKIGLEINYHMNENHSLGLMFTSNSTGLSKDAQGLKNDFGLDFNRAPKPLNSLMLDYGYSPFYGKMSVTKDGVMNTTIYGTGSIGVVKYEHKSYPAISIGIGERFYFTHRLSLKADLKIFAHQAPIPFKSGALRDGSAGSGFVTDPVPALDSFQERLTYTTNLQIGFNYLF